MVSSTIDFPLQSRAVELVDEGNGFLSIYITNFDHNSESGTLGSKARQLAGGNKVFGPNGTVGNITGFWLTDVQAQNLLLRLELPADIALNLENYSWPDQIESTETLNNL